MSLKTPTNEPARNLSAAPSSAAPPPPHVSTLGPLLLVSLALLSAAAPLGTDMYLASMVQLAQDLHTSASAAQLTLSAFMIGMGLGQLIIGPISDSIGRRRPLVIGSVCFLISSVCVALAPNIELLIALRFVMGLAGGTGVVLARAVVADLADANGAAKAYALLMAIQGLAPVIAPVLGGVLSGPIGWRGIFAVLAIFNAFMALAAIFVVPESLPASKRNGAGVSQVWHDLSAMLGNLRFIGYGIIFAVGFGVMFAYISASPFVLQGEYGLSKINYSLAFAGNAVLMAIVAAASARLVEHFQIRHLMLVGLGLMTLGTAGLVIASLLGTTPLGLVIGLLALTLAGISLSSGNATALAISALSGRAAGTGSGLLGAAQFLVAAVVSPLVGLGHRPVVSMALVMAGCLAITLAVGLPLSRSSRGAATPQQAREV
ncbi:MFS transporter, DHA1 family, bicyclomycin/chloramphenicol resistance protein [Propionibacterium cyclohexanicum]|uniref:MFS transporter, DHA1 family, bicyclomycin/chloramphenicol resistance protein n=1 Tax=Propionibacterium cyclohexanicum TaxID=64702 RepID=A0A1H9S1W4_9ACTN|nr:multidrug effflux MFS transporter [Propionibacterium cyclohexanicum]SER79046.1 MFS transporter, DHA1 family, bicyclomycin/chloramphenicol resistance protein [Propionibacterium cyclohexanicum]